jgi:hypothetical protein
MKCHRCRKNVDSPLYRVNKIGDIGIFWCNECIKSYPKMGSSMDDIKKEISEELVKPVVKTNSK